MSEADSEVKASAWEPTTQMVRALAVRTKGMPWWTIGMMHHEDIEQRIAYWKDGGYEVRVLLSELPI